LTIYAVAKAEVYVNNQDDRQRGVHKNPFSKGAAPKTPLTNKLPAPGDVDLESDALYSSPKKKGKLGTAALQVPFNVSGFADADTTLDLAGGAIVAEGAIKYNDTSFSLAIVGGTGAYIGATGELSVAPATKGVQKLTVDLLST
jgi:hypothetical protein